MENTTLVFRPEAWGFEKVKHGVKHEGLKRFCLLNFAFCLHSPFSILQFSIRKHGVLKKLNRFVLRNYNLLKSRSLAIFP